MGRHKKSSSEKELRKLDNQSLTQLKPKGKQGTGLRKNALPMALLKRIEIGEEKTIEQWATAFKTSRQIISSALASLRRHGYECSPVGGYSNPYAQEFRAGIVRNILKSKNDVKEIMVRNTKREVTPRLKSAFRLLEKAIEEYPEMLSLIETEANKILMVTIERKESLKQLEAAK